MSLEQPSPFNLQDLTLDVRLQAIIDGNSKDFTGKEIFSVEFFRKSVGFGITSVEIEVNTSLQPIITINFKDLYGNTVFGKSKDESPDSSMNDTADFSVLFNWPPPKFLFTFKGFLGKSATWMLNMKKSSVSFNSSDGSYDIKCEFVPNQWGFLADLPFLYLLAVKALKKKSGLPDEEFKKIQTIFDLIKIGKQVDVKTKETTKEFDNVLKQMTLLKSQRIYDALFISKVINYGEAITGQVGNQTISPFDAVTINSPSGTGNGDIDSAEKIKSLAVSAINLRKINTFLLLTAKIGNLEPKPIKFSDVSTDKGAIAINGVVNIDQEISMRTNILTDNIKHIEDAIKLKSYDSSKSQIEKITIGEIFEQIAKDAGYIMGRILEAGYLGHHKNIDSRENNKKLIGKSFPMVITENEEKPATKQNAGEDVGVENYELQFVNDFIDAISEGIATELADDKSAAENVGDNLIKKRINNLEALRPNPYQPFYQNIAENIMIRGGVVAYLTRSPDPNKPGDYDTYLGFDRATNAEDVVSLADADLENITDSIISGLSDGDFKELKKFCIFWDNLLTEDCESLRKSSTVVGEFGKLIDGDDLSGGYLSSPGTVLPDKMMDYKVVIEKPAQWNGDITKQVDGLQTGTLREIVQGIFRPRPSSGSTNSSDTTNSNFIDTKSLQALKVINNGISYFKVPGSTGFGKDHYTFVMFDGPEANKTQQIVSAASDSEIKNDAEKQKDKTKPLGFVNVQNPKKDDTNFVDVINGMNDDRIPNGLLLNYSRLLNPNSAFFKNATSLVADNNIDGYFIIPKTIKLGDADNPNPNEIPAKNITISVAHHSNNSNELVFGPFVDGSDDSLVHRGYIKRMCVKLKEKLDGVEQKRNQVISNVLGKAGEQTDLLYKQMHVLYQQWEVLITSDSASADGQKTDGSEKGVISSEMAARYGEGKHIEFSNLAQSVADNAADNTFLYAYPLNSSPGVKQVNVRNSIINIDPLYSPNGNTTVLNMIQQICTKNNFIFIPMPGEPGSFSTSEIYSPHVTDTPKVKNFFYVQFAPTPESRSTVSNSDNSPLSSSPNIKNYLPNGTLLVKFGSPDNQIVKNITVDTQESKATAESIINLQRLVDNENQNKKVTTDCSMLPVMEGRSYKASAEMLGNAQVFPMQFFYLDSNPLFNGLYQIMKVKHNIKPNDMTTTSEGIRMRMDFQTGKFGGIPPVTLESLAALPVTLLTAEPPIFTAGDFADFVQDQGVGTQDGTSGTESAGSSNKSFSVLTTRGGSDIVPNTIVSSSGIILPPDLRAVQNSIRLTQSSTGNKAIPIDDTDATYTKDVIIRNLNQFITDVLGPFATFLKQNYPHLYKNWYFTSAQRSYVPYGGAKISQHEKGQAVDSQIIGKAKGVDTMKINLELLNAILAWYQTNPIGYDQILYETRSSQNASWIHWSYKRNDNRLMLLRLSSDRTNQLAKVNTTGKYVLPGVTEQQVILSMT